MLNLQKLKERTYDITYFDGTIINLNKPTQELYRELTEISNYSDEEVTEMLEVIYNVVTKSLNNNINNRVFEVNDIKEAFDLEVAFIFIQDYLSDTLNVLGE